MTSTRNKLIEAANSALRNAYSPYSKFRVGAAIRSKDGKIFTGCNIENVSYSLAICAERVALFKAVSEGNKLFDSIAISSSGAKAAFPCGACRQVLNEFSPDLIVYLDQGSYQLSDLISHPFSIDQMTLNEKDREILGTRYLELLCDKAREYKGKKVRFSKIEVYGKGRFDGYNRDIVIPLIIRKLRQLGYIQEYTNDEISLTPLGRKNCGKQVVVEDVSG